MYTLCRSVYPSLFTARATQRLCQGALLRLFCTWLPQTPGCFAPTARADLPKLCKRDRSYPRANRFNASIKVVLPKLWPATAASMHYSTYGTLPTMNRFGSSPFSLDAGFPSCTHVSTRFNSIITPPYRFLVGFLACADWLFGCTIDACPLARMRFRYGSVP